MAETKKLENWQMIAIILGIGLGIGAVVLYMASKGATGGGIFKPKPPSTPPTSQCPDSVSYVHYRTFKQGQKVKVMKDPYAQGVLVRYEPCIPSMSTVTSVDSVEAEIQMDWGVAFKDPVGNIIDVFWKVYIPSWNRTGWVSEGLIVAE